MLTLKTLTYQNFLSSGNDPITIDFQKAKTTLVVGSNGAGKSTMLDALSFALFGKPHRNINKGQLCNSINQKKAAVEVEFSVNNHEYKVVRGIKPNKFEIFQDGKIVDQESHARDYQKVLENNILKLNHRSFHQVVVLGSSNFIPFMQLSTAQRREVIEDLLDIRIFAKMNDLLKEKVHSNRNLLKDVDHNINLMEEKIRMQNKHIMDLEKIEQENAQKVEEEIGDLKGNIEDLSNEIEQGKINCDEALPKLKSEKEASEKRWSKLSLFEQSIRNKIKGIQDQLSFYEENDVCPTCKTKIDDEQKNSKVSELKGSKEELENGLGELNSKMDETNNEYQRLKSELQEVEKIHFDVISKQRLLIEYQSQIQKLNEKLLKPSEATDTKGAKDQLREMNSKKSQSVGKRDEIKLDQEYNSAIASILKDNGIKTKIIKQYLPTMNKLINNYLNVLDFFVSFNLDDSFNETIKSRHRDEFSYASFSEGEKSRIDLSLLFAWRQISKMKNSLSTNLLILDEVMDSSLDVDGVDNLNKILSTLGEDTNVFVISHKKEFVEGKFDRKLEFTKPKNFSKMVETSC